MLSIHKVLHVISVHSRRPLARAANILVITLTGALVAGTPAFAQPNDGANDTPGTIVGAVIDTSNDPIPSATVILEGPQNQRQVDTTKDDGTFAFQSVTPGLMYRVTVAADGFSDWTSSITVDAGQQKSLSDVRLHMLAVQRAVTVSYSSGQVAAQQLKMEEQQRILKFIPNIYVTYNHDAEPLTSAMKFHLAYKSLSNPMFFARVTAWAGVQQAAGTPDWPQNANGFGKRLGAGFADSLTEDLVGNAILPSVLHQDPRYFYQGDGTKKSRAVHAILAAFVCKGDNGKWQPNYSTFGGSLISSSVSMAYYPSGSRDPSHVFRDFGIGMGLHVGASLAQEFILDKFTSKGAH